MATHVQAPPSRHLLQFRRVLVLRPDKGPNLVTFKTLAREVDETVVLVGTASVAKTLKQFLDRGPVDTRHVDYGPEAVTLDERCHDFRLCARVKVVAHTLMG
jgi:hypothetical protein